MQSSDTLDQIRASINYVMDRLEIPDYVNPEDVEQQIALTHLELLTKDDAFASMEEFHMKILSSIEDWLVPTIVGHDIKVSLRDCREVSASDRQSMLENLISARDTLNHAIDVLSPRQKYVIERAYGIHTTPKNTAEIANELGVSPNRVTLIKNTAIATMRRDIDRVDHLTMIKCAT